MTLQYPRLDGATGHAEILTSDALSVNQVVEVNNLSFIVASDLDAIFRDELIAGEIPLPSQGSTGSAGVLSFNGATGHVQGVSSFNGATGAVVYVIDGGEI
jgi:hypothetical protein